MLASAFSIIPKNQGKLIFFYLPGYIYFAFYIIFTLLLAFIYGQVICFQVFCACSCTLAGMSGPCI